MEFGESSYGKEKYSEAELYWMDIFIVIGPAHIRKQVSKYINLLSRKNSRALYYPYHSLDPAQAIERILEARGVNEKDLTARGVKIMRDIMKSEKKQ